MKKDLMEYSMQIAMLSTLLSHKLITEREYDLLKRKIMKDYGVISDLMAGRDPGDPLYKFDPYM